MEPGSLVTVQMLVATVTVVTITIIFPQSLNKRHINEKLCTYKNSVRETPKMSGDLIKKNSKYSYIF